MVLTEYVQSSRLSCAYKYQVDKLLHNQWTLGISSANVGRAEKDGVMSDQGESLTSSSASSIIKMGSCETDFKLLGRIYSSSASFTAMRWRSSVKAKWGCNYIHTSTSVFVHVHTKQQICVCICVGLPSEKGLALVVPVRVGRRQMSCCVFCERGKGPFTFPLTEDDLSHDLY